MNDMTPSSHSPISKISESWKRERPDLDLTHFLLVIYIMRLGRTVDDAYDVMCRKRFGISGNDMRVLFALRRAGKPYTRRSIDLFRALVVASGTITKQVDRLSRLGFVERTADMEGPAGIRLTAKGLRAANAATDTLATDSPLAPGLASMTKAELNAGRQFIEKALLGLEAAARGTPPGSGQRRKKSGETGT
jgi:DNA-binding MarR family transcriptional regulator